MFHTGKELFIKILDKAANNSEIGDGDIPQHPGRKMSDGWLEILELERDHVMPDTTPQSGDTVLK